ncbi:TonB-linked outer membrane protein, SusC/RagA family [Chitinophaga eiseniae]|uniref:TonB-linked outer membrane protein, SusC/RagA family n=1 Tax=Chitinophaga eiseniae TaxID=634771 RepID=A0A1T4U693_9BACT|nr:TonB-dependent receptor [Chitinophaga eiseniae]SKA48176.1 TonB-linked outer membrane protein, SusC/RagA family [Chitinophaga eiseniae]
MKKFHTPFRRWYCHPMLLLFLLLSQQVFAQEKVPATGTVTDSSGRPLPGVTVMAANNKSLGTATDNNGKFTISVNPGTTLLFKFVGFKGDTIIVTEKTHTFSIQLKPLETVLTDVVVTAFGRKQIKESVVGSVSTITADNLRTSGSNLTNALAGQVAGVIGFQQSGQPGLDNSNFFIRGVTTFGYRQNPLILIDNVELTTNDLARLQVNDIASFSILKDASATALYGARGANGVILVTTKEGKEGKTRLNLILENAISTPTQSIKLADPITYMKLYNEAGTTRDPLQPITFDADKIYNTQQTLDNAPGSNPYVYPAVDWLDLMFKKYASTQRANLNVSGGGDIARFLVSGSFSNDNGMLKRSSANNFNNNVNYKNYQLRSNVNVKLTKSTEMVLRLWGNFNDYNGPLTNDASFSSDLYSAAVHTSPVLFPAYYAPDSANRLVQHILFGNSSQSGGTSSIGTGVGYSNPYAQMMRGYKRFSESRMSATLELHQDFSFITPGLKFHGFFNTNRYSYFDNTMAYNPFYYTVQPQDYNKATGEYRLTWLNSLPGGIFLGSLGSGDNGAATEYLIYSPGRKDANTFLQFQGQLEYHKQLGEHDISASLIGVRQQRLVANGTNPVTQQPSLQYSLPYRNLNLAGRLSYNYATRYFLEFNFGNNGSERFSRNNRFGFFPTVGASWIVSRENFWSEGLTNVITSLKLRASYGLSGNDDIGQQRFFYLSDVNLNASNGSYFGLQNIYLRRGVKINNYENTNVTWETAKILNTGIEFTLFKNFDFIAEYWKQDRSNILMKRNIPSSMGLEADILTNVGTVKVNGLDLTANYNQVFSKNLRIQYMSNFTYSKGTYGTYEEPQYAEPWRYVSGTMLNQKFGYIAERLFVDDKEALASPSQTFGGNPPRGGDIKYRDLNGDGRLTVADMVPLGFPTVPQIMYGFGFSINYKGFELNARFQGQARVSFFIDPRSVSPFVIPPSPQIQSQSQILQAFADNHWSEENQNLYALYPRLGTSAQAIENNLQQSSWWMRDGSFLRLKTAEIGYVLPASLMERIGVRYCRIYVNGLNLFNITKFKLWDPELGSNGFNYPIQRVYNIGLNVNL